MCGGGGDTLSFFFIRRIGPNCDISDNNSLLKCVIADVTGK